MKIKEALYSAVEKLKSNKVDEPIIKARILLAYVLQVEKEYLIIHSEEEVDNLLIDKYNDKVKELIMGKPIQYITHHQEFMKLDFYVDENVLIPRADTEILVEEVIANCNRNPEKSFEILDLCTGSGAIGVSLGKYIKNSNITCTDISESALKIANKNAKVNGVENIEFVHSDMFDKIEKRFDIIVSNPPYIRKDVIVNLDKEVQNEPHIALDGGIDGLDFYRIIVNEAENYLKVGGLLLLEIGYDQKDDLLNLINHTCIYKDVYSKKDLYGHDRIVVASL